MKPKSPRPMPPMTLNFDSTMLPDSIDQNHPNFDEKPQLWDFEKMEKQKISISIPNVLLRKFPGTNQAYLVYQIHIRLSTTATTNTPNTDFPKPTIQPRIEWHVYHRYTTLSRLHADLAGNLIDESGPESPSPNWPRLAHECLPRPLPGIGLLKFPSKHLVPSVPKLVRHTGCVRKGFENSMPYEDYQVCLGRRSRCESRRQKLETYLQNLAMMVWQLTEDCDDVADVYRSMMTPQPGGPFADPTNPDLLVPGWAELKQIHKKFLKLLPIFEP